MHDITLEDFIDRIAQHHKDSPSHGIDCVCMDKYIHRLKHSTQKKYTINQWDRIKYVLRMAGRIS